MVVRNRKGSPFAVFQSRRFSTLLRTTAQTVESLSGSFLKFRLEAIKMLFKFLTQTGTKRLTFTVRAQSEQEARQNHHISPTALCVARYSDAFLAKKQARMTACEEVRYV